MINTDSEIDELPPLKVKFLFIEILESYAAGTVTELKDSYLNVKARNTGNKTVIIEMQVINVPALENFRFSISKILIKLNIF